MADRTTCKYCGIPAYSYEAMPLFPDEDGRWTMEKQWVHVYPTKDGHAVQPAIVDRTD